MCGITGIYDYGRTAGNVDAQLLEQMRETLHHRGPDGAGQWVSDDRRVGLAMRRLAILDIEGGAQPMFGEHGEVLVFNGEIYNYPYLRDDLERQGVRFQTRCDTEVILRLYERHGIGCLEHLNGMFAIALWDPREQRLLLARDRVGEKPLYWAQASGTLIFASEIKALLEHPLITPAVNEQALGPYLTNLVTTPPETLYAGISKLAPGTFAVCDRGGVRTERWWDLFAPRRFNDVSVEEARDTVRSMLDRSVHDRLLSDVPVGVLLSGGLDSTTLVALLRERAVGLATFSVGFADHPALDERDQARRVAEQFGTDHHEVVVSEQRAIEFLPSLVHHQDEPLADPVCIPLHFVCELARSSGVPVVLAGEGADELFWGYPSYRQVMARERWMETIMRLPPVLRRGLAASIPPERFLDLRQWAEGLASGRPLPMHMPVGIRRHQRARIMLDKRGALNAGWTPSNAGSSNGAVDLPTQLALDTQEYEFGLRLPELLLMRIDRFSMANSVEARVPFLDPHLVEYVYRLPVERKFRDGLGKLVLRDAISDVVPSWVLERRKQGFGAPVLSWLGSDLGSLFDQLLRGEALQRYFDVRRLRAALAHPSRRWNYGLWPILNFALWHHYWIERQPLEALIDPLIRARV